MNSRLINVDFLKHSKVFEKFYYFVNMINSRNKLSYYLEKDRARMHSIGIPNFKDWILHNEKWYVNKYLVALRHVEYYYNTCSKYDVRFLYWWFLYKRIGFKMRYNIAPNTTGPGLIIYHTGDFIWVEKGCKIGENCTLRPGVVFGRKNDKSDSAPVVVGDNCEFGVGAKIIGTVKIGNNVIVGANAVVVNDIPDNAVAVGVPAKVIKKKISDVK